ncbi:MAG: leucyl/phenylalanyl-tRNA--protein transferase [Phycisphaeraceae bacterium]
MSARDPIPTDMLLWAYANGIFPMADSRTGGVEWYSADPRAVLPLNGFQMSHSLRQRLRRGTYQIRVDTAFESVIRACAEPRPGHPETWINDQIIDAFVGLHQSGLTHSVEAWISDDDLPADEKHPLHRKPAAKADGWHLVGGLYGLSLGGAFFGESMFSRATDASKVCLAHLVEHLKTRGYALLDTQMNSGHMAQFGVVNIPREHYLRRLEKALKMEVAW